MKVAGVVLAAGASQRMGFPKARLRCGSKTFLETLTGALIQGGCRPVMAVVSESLELRQKNCQLEEVRLVINPDTRPGPISSLRCALDVLPQVDGLVLALVDQAMLKVDTVHRVHKALEVASVAVARYQGIPGHPTGFSKQVFDLLRSPLADVGAVAVVRKLEREDRVHWVDVDDPGVIRNINTPDDYEVFLRGCGLSR